MMSLLRCSTLLQYCLVDFIAVGAVSSVLYDGDSAALAVSPMLPASVRIGSTVYSVSLMVPYSLLSRRFLPRYNYVPSTQQN